ncbi:PAS domain-containing protein [Chenggangzhangella methanolivorans]|uniref:PAS domain-containing protein n=1 Tax=Chenggangzhangella methanolivorans TaxID=1437009 RepID=UPI0021BD8ABB|nr:PAS domain-containing protein [Chenggangzhangella methanolivorans]
MAELRGESDPYGAAIRSTRMPIVICDATLDDCPIVFANDAFVSLSGYPREEIIGRNCRFLQGPETDRAEVARVSQAIVDGSHVDRDPELSEGRHAFLERPLHQPGPRRTAASRISSDRKST